MSVRRARACTKEGESPLVVHLTTVHHAQDPRITYRQLPTLSAAGCRVLLVASGRPADLPTHVSTVRLPPTETRLQRIPLQWTAYRTARAQAADLYHIHDPELIPVAYLLRRATGAAIIYDMHENYRSKGPVWGRVLRGLERWALRWVDHVVLAEESYQSIVDPAPVGATCILNYHKPWTDERPAPDLGEEGPTRLLYTGTVSRARGLDTMLRVVAGAGRDPGLRLRLVGVCNRAHERAAAEATIRDNDLGETVTRVGWDAYVPPTDMPPHYRWADVGLALFEPHPNFAGSMPTKFYEYMHHGLPIIAADVPLWRRFLRAHDCGVVVPPGDAEAVRDVLSRWRADPARYRALARNARAAAPKYRWKPMGDRLVRLYRELLTARDGGSPSRATG
jgi:glycosyltransferase involved in cell wall biosynthesis